jgi:hypothetical protein
LKREINNTHEAEPMSPRRIRELAEFTLRQVFPAQIPIGDNRTFDYYGITKRELFAMAALQGMRAAPNSRSIPRELLAQEAMLDADALIAALHEAAAADAVKKE